MKAQPTDFRTEERSQTPQRTYLYHFNYQGTHYYYTNYDQDLSIIGGPGTKMADPQPFLAVQIAHGNREESMDSVPTGIMISLAATDSELRKYFITVSPKQIDVEVWRVNSASLPGALAYADDMKMIFKGIVDSISYDDQIVTASCITLMQREDMPIPRFFYQKMCNHMLYDPAVGSCQVNPALYEVSLAITTLDRPSGWIEFNALTTINVDSPSRTITITQETFHAGTVADADGNQMGVLVCQPLTGPTRVRLWLTWMPRSLTAGATVTLRCGCLYIKRTCHDLFNNLPNIGATPYVPIANPAIHGINV